MLAVTILLVVLLGAINVFNFTSVSKDIEEALDEIVSSNQLTINFSAGGPFRNMNSYESTEDSFGNFQSGDDAENEEDEGDGQSSGGFSSDGAAYFSVTLDTSGNALVIVMNGVSSVTQDEAVSMAQGVFETKSVSGSDGDFRYTGYTTPNSSGITYVFMDTSYYKNGVVRIGLLSLLAGAACWLAMFLLIFFLSKKFINPIAENIERQKMFISDAGHEIKTPIAIIQANAEALELYTGQSKWSRNIREQTAKLTGLVSNLLTLSKASETYEKVVVYDVDLTQVVRSNVEMFIEPAAMKAKLLNFDVNESIFVKGDKEQFGRIVSLLLDNAVKYAREMSEIDIEIIPSAKTVCFKVTNECDELPQCEPERLFDRFYRPDSSHNSATGGNGIGLATVKAIAERYDAHSSCVYGDQKISFLVEFKKA